MKEEFAWDTHETVSRIYAIKIGNLTLTVQKKGKCQSGECDKWVASFVPLMHGIELEVDNLEDAKVAALLVVRAELLNLIKQLPIEE